MSVKKVWKFTRRFFERSSRLSAIINKSRLFNTYECLYEMFCIIFYNAVASRLNQSSLVFGNTIFCVVSIFGQILIHVSPREMYYKMSIFVNLSCEGVLMYQMLLIWNCFKAVINSCSTIWTYYEVKYQGDRTKALSHLICTNSESLHAQWMVVNGVLLMLRVISAYYMIKGLLYLLKRLEEKQRRLQRQIMKAKRFRERRRNELERKIAKAKMEKREEMLRERRMIDEDQIREEE